MSEPLRVLIVDDEPLARRGVRARLAEHADIKIVGECTDGQAAVRAIRAKHPDLVFLDIQMPGLDGFGVIERIGREQMPTVVFLTAFDEHAIKAFEAEAMDYLLKPIDDDRFARTLERVRERIAHRNAENREATGTARIAVRDRGRVVMLEANEISHLVADGDYVQLYAGGRQYLLRETMGAIEARLPRTRFVRVHRSYIVSVAFVRELLPLRNGEQVVVMRNGARLRLSRTYRSRLARLMAESR